VRARRLIRALLAALAVLLAAVPSVFAQEPLRFDYRDTFTTRTPGAGTGRMFNIDFFNPADREGKPPAFSHVHLELPEGARFDTGAITQCEATDVELMAQGPDACPAESRLGTNVLVADTGFPGDARYITTDFVFLNAKDELIALGKERQSQQWLAFRAKIGERTFDLDFPPLPGTPPDGGADKSERAIFNAASSVVDGKTRNYVTTPPTCPADGTWEITVTYSFRDGVDQTGVSSTPCDRPGEPPDPQGPGGGVTPSCVRYVGKVSSSSISGVKLGAARADVLAALGQPFDIDDQKLVYCVGRAAAVDQRLYIGFAADGTVNVIATTGRHHKVRDIGPSSSVRRFKKVFPRVKRRVAGSYVRRASAGAILFHPDGSRLDYVAVATRALSRDGAELRSELGILGLN
jgi:hypothetical protein